MSRYKVQVELEVSCSNLLPGKETDLDVIGLTPQLVSCFTHDILWELASQGKLSTKTVLGRKEHTLIMITKVSPEIGITEVSPNKRDQ
jgi:hypothetical protein